MANSVNYWIKKTECDKNPLLISLEFRVLNLSNYHTWEGIFNYNLCISKSLEIGLNVPQVFKYWGNRHCLKMWLCCII